MADIRNIRFPQAVKLFSLCPTLDLVVVVSEEGSLETYRFTISGQPASGSASGLSVNDKGIAFVRWADDGETIVTITEQGEIQSRSSAKPREILRTGPVGLDQTNQVSCVGVSRHVIDRSMLAGLGLQGKRYGAKAEAEKSPSGLADSWDILDDAPAQAGSLEDLLDVRKESSLANFHLVDLPRRLALEDVQQELPLLKAPVHFTKARTNATFHNPDFTHPNTRAILNGRISDRSNLPVASNRDNRNIVDVIETFALGGSHQIFVGVDTIQLACITHTALKLEDQDYVETYGLQVSHPLSSKSACLVEAKPLATAAIPSNGSLFLRVYSLGPLDSSGCFLEPLFFYYAEYLTLESYLAITADAMHSTWIANTEIQSKFVRNLAIALEEDENFDVMSSLVHLAMTGHCLPPVAEWLVDQVDVRGHKRWDEGMRISCYQKLYKLLADDLLPAIERMTVVVCRLRTLSRTPELTVFQPDEEGFARMLLNLENLTLAAHHMLSYVSEERRQFDVFSAWLLCQIESCRAEPDSQGARDAAEKAAAINYVELVDYITGPLTRSHLAIFLGRSLQDSLAMASEQGTAQLPDISRKLMTQMLDRHGREALQPKGDTVEFLNLTYLALALGSAKSTFTKLTDGFARSIYEESLIKLPSRHWAAPRDLKIVFEHRNEKEFVVIVVLVVDTETPGKLTIFAYDEQSTPASDQAASGHVCALAEGEIVDLSFFDDESAIVLLKTKHKTTVFQVFYGKLLRDALHGVDGACVQSVFQFDHVDGQGDFVPVEIQCNGRKDRRTIAFLERDRKRLRLLKLEP